MLNRIRASILYRTLRLRSKFKKAACQFTLSRKRRQVLDLPYKVSIIAAVYNTEKYLRQCLDSVLNQTYRNIEVVCVNDCSTDGSLDVLKEYAQRDSRIVIVDKPVNEGLPQARKSGFAASCGQWVLMLDSDDWVEKNMIESMLGIAVLGGFDMTYCDIFWGTRGEEFIQLLQDVPQDRLQRIKRLILGHGSDRNVWNKLVKREVCDKIEFPTESIGEDNYISCQMFYYSNTVGYVPLPLYHYRFNEKSLTNDSQKAALRYLDMKANFEHIINFCREMFGDDLRAFEPELSVRMEWLESIRNLPENIHSFPTQS